MRHVLDAGALMAVERGDRDMIGRLRLAHGRGDEVVTHGGVVGQVWRGGARQARLAAALQGIDIRPLDGTLGRRAGSLLAATGGRDVIDAAVALLAGDGDEITTSDPDDLLPLVVVTGAHVELRRV
ncbi:MAG: PIN domain nuclease [Solirubrobacteraceae bacterium]